MSSRTCRHAVGAAQHLPVDEVGQAAFETPHGLHAGLARGLFLSVVGPAWRVMTQLHDRHDVLDPVGPAGARPGEPVPALITGGRVQRRCAVPGRETTPIGEAGDVTDVAQQTSRAGGPDPEQLQQRASAAGNQLPQLFVRDRHALVDHFQLGDQIFGQPPAGPTRHIAGRDRYE